VSVLVRLLVRGCIESLGRLQKLSWMRLDSLDAWVYWTKGGCLLQLGGQAKEGPEGKDVQSTNRVDTLLRNHLIEHWSPVLAPLKPMLQQSRAAMWVPTAQLLPKYRWWHRGERKGWLLPSAYALLYRGRAVEARCRGEIWKHGDGHNRSTHASLLDEAKKGRLGAEVRRWCVVRGAWCTAAVGASSPGGQLGRRRLTRVGRPGLRSNEHGKRSAVDPCPTCSLHLDPSLVRHY